VVSKSKGVGPRSKPDPVHLTTLEATVLERLARSRVTPSATRFAIDWDEDLRREQDLAVTYDLVEWLLKGLNERGLIVYRVGKWSNHSDSSTGDEVFVHTGWDVPTNIRVTDLGYRSIGYERHTIVGPRRSYSGEDPIRPGDTTDFRFYRPFSSYGCGTVVRWPDLASHLDDVPDCPAHQPR